ncbi:MAG: GerMN domain-containing protein [Gemmatimonadetes bacterium]|nr:GerMN domain-containing protein [Gemmatimonadota bacterium]
MKWWVIGGVGALALAAGLLFALQREEAPVVSAPEAEVLGTRSVDLYFPGLEGELVTETREIVGAETTEKDIRRVVEELIDGGSRGIRPLPASTRLLNVFLDGAGEATLNFSEHFRSDHPGGSEAELATLRCLVASVATNFPGVDRVRLLVDGEVVPTLAGHADLSRPLTVQDYR